MGAAYDEERGFPVYDGKKHFPSGRTFFEERCCYCGSDLVPGYVAQDHLVPMNKTSLGLHAWGNIVPACDVCNAKKQGQPWQDYLVQRAGAHASERYQKVNAFVAEHKYAPDLVDLRGVAEELYDEVGTIAMTLVSMKVKRIRDKL